MPQVGDPKKAAAGSAVSYAGVFDGAGLHVRTAGRGGAAGGESTAAPPPHTHSHLSAGHGGYAVADWLEQRLLGVIEDNWVPAAPGQSMTDAFLAADR